MQTGARFAFYIDERPLTVSGYSLTFIMPARDVVITYSKTACALAHQHQISMQPPMPTAPARIAGAGCRTEPTSAPNAVLP